MFRSATLFCACMITGLAFTAPQKISTRLTPLMEVETCENVFRQEPSVILDITGGTLLGPVQETVIVYNNGHIVRSESSFFTETPTVETGQTTSGSVSSLVRNLSLTGAFELCDEPTPISDIPLTTITVLNGKGNSRAHTFSFYQASGAHGTAEDVIRDWLEENL